MPDGPGYFRDADMRRAETTVAITVAAGGATVVLAPAQAGRTPYVVGGRLSSTAKPVQFQSVTPGPGPVTTNITGSFNLAGSPAASFADFNSPIVGKSGQSLQAVFAAGANPIDGFVNVIYF